MKIEKMESWIFLRPFRDHPSSLCFSLLCRERGSKEGGTHCQVCCNSLAMTFRHWGKSYIACRQLAPDFCGDFGAKAWGPLSYPDLASTCSSTCSMIDCSCINCPVPCRHHNCILLECYLFYCMPLISFLWQTKCYPLLRIQGTLSSPGRVFFLSMD